MGLLDMWRIDIIEKTWLHMYFVTVLRLPFPAESGIQGSSLDWFREAWNMLSWNKASILSPIQDLLDSYDTSS